MNHTKLVGIIKTVITEAHHKARYNYGRKNLGKPGLHVPDKSLQVAEEEDADRQPDAGMTMTKQRANKINVKPEYNANQVQHPQGSKPSIDTK